MYVTDTVIGEAPNTVLQYNVVHAAVHNFLCHFGNKALNDKLTDVPLFHGQKIYTVSNFSKQKIMKNIEMKNAEPCSVSFW